MMDAVTHPNEAVVEFLASRMISLRLHVQKEPYRTKYQIRFLPTVLVLDEDGSEHHRLTGFSAPEKFLPSLSLGIAKLNLEHGYFDLALEELGEILQEKPDSNLESEAIFTQGVARFRSTSDAVHLEEAFQQLSTLSPGNYWTKKAQEFISSQR